MRIGLRDRRVIRAFLDRRALDGHKLWTDGTRLDGHWIGGRDIVHHNDTGPWGGPGSLTFPDLGSKAADTVQKLVIKMKDAGIARSERVRRRRR